MVANTRGWLNTYYVTTYDVPHLEVATVGEIYAASGRVYFLGDDSQGDIYEYIFSSGLTNVVVT